MSTVISAGTTTNTAYNVNADTSGSLALATGSGPTTAVTIDSSQNTTLAGSLNAPNTFGFKNRIINGAMNIWQRGTSFSGNGYTADRWNAGNSPTAVAQTTDVPSGYTYSLQITGANHLLNQRIESYNSLDLTGTTTISFWAKNVSGTNTLSIQIGTAGAVNNFTTQNVEQTSSAITLTSSWSQYSVTFPALSASVVNGVFIYIYRNGSTASDSTKITGVQLEKGSTATSFDYRPYGTELALCQRYYWRNGGSAQGGLYAPFATGVNTSTTNFSAVVQFPVRMRAAPSFVTGGSTPNIQNGTYSSVTLDRASFDQMLLAINLTGATNGAANRYIGNADGTTYWEFSAEL